MKYQEGQTHSSGPAAVLDAFGQPLRIRQVTTPAPGYGEVAIDVRACGLCLTDVHIVEGRIPSVTLPLVPGHEFAGVVAQLGQGVTNVVVGDRVTVCVDVVCQRCDRCLRGETNRCQALSRIGFERPGGMATRVNVPAANVEQIADHVSFEKAAVIPDAVAAMYRSLVSVAQVRPGESVAIVGVGGLGIQGVKLASRMGASVVAVDIDDRKLDRALTLGAQGVVNPARVDLAQAAARHGTGFDVVIDIVGKRTSFAQSICACRPGGRVVAMGYAEPTLDLPAYETVIREKTILGSRSATRAEFKSVVELVNAGAFDPDIGLVLPIDQVNSALEDLRAGRYLTRTVLTLPFNTSP